MHAVDLIRASEAERIGTAYDAVTSEPAGPADDPRVHIAPDDVEGVVVARGGFKGRGDASVQGSGWGLAKIIWRHGEKSNKPAKFKLSRNDLTSFPDVIRNYEPTREAVAGGQGREWRVSLPGPDGTHRTVVFADNKLTRRGDIPYLVSAYVQEPAEAAFAASLSRRKVRSPESPGRTVGGPAEDTAAGAFAHGQQGRGDPVMGLPAVPCNVEGAT